MPTWVCLNPSPSDYDAFSFGKNQSSQEVILGEMPGNGGTGLSPTLRASRLRLSQQLCSFGCRDELNFNLSSQERKEQ